MTRHAAVSPERLLSEGYRLQEAGRLDEAAECCRNILLQHPRHVDALNLLASTRLRHGDRAGFLDTIGRSLQAQPQQPGALHDRGVVLSELKRFHEALESFDQAIAASPAFALSHHQRGKALRILGRGEEALASQERAIGLVPTLWPAHLERGHTLRALGRFEAASSSYGQVLSQVDSADAHYYRAHCLHRLERFDDALAGYRQALRLRPDDALVLNGLALAQLHAGGGEEALQTCARALRHKPEFAPAWNTQGNALEALGRLEEAVHSYDTVLRIAPDNASAKLNMAQVLLALGRYTEGWSLYECRLGPAPPRARRWDGTALAGKTLLIVCEQGFGDALQFIRYARHCKALGGRVAVAAPAPLVRLFRHSADVDAVVTDPGEAVFDHYIEMLSLPHLLRTTLADVPAAVPYLRTDPGLRRQWAQRLASAGGRKVGLVWAGSPAIERGVDRRRSLHLAAFRPLLALGGANFFSLQLGEGRQQIAELGLHDHLQDLASQISDFMDTAAIIDNLDLVITVDTAVAHLAGALAKPVWLLSRFDGCWRWLRNQPRNPWYPTVRVFGQPAPGRWDLVIERVHATLQEDIARARPQNR